MQKAPTSSTRWIIEFPEVASVVLGMRTEEQVAQNSALYTAGVPGALWDELAELGLVPPVT